MADEHSFDVVSKVDMQEVSNAVQQAVKEIGAKRVLYGSDMPFHDPAFDMARIEYAKISEEEKKLIMGENAKRLLDSLGK